jgi:6-pyruvoyltetrahydropterin/6-carboxytetrahydropterin synthase
MLLDFGVVKAKIKTVVEELDHNYLNEVKPFTGSAVDNPTVENLARHIYNRLKQDLEQNSQPVQIACVRVWESPDTSVAYSEV